MINGAADYINKNIYEILLKNNLEKLDSKITNNLEKRKYIFSSELEYNNFISELNTKIDSLETSSVPNF